MSDQIPSMNLILSRKPDDLETFFSAEQIDQLLRQKMVDRVRPFTRVELKTFPWALEVFREEMIRSQGEGRRSSRRNIREVIVNGFPQK